MWLQLNGIFKGLYCEHPWIYQTLDIKFLYRCEKISFLGKFRNMNEILRNGQVAVHKNLGASSKSIGLKPVLHFHFRIKLYNMYNSWLTYII